MEQRERRKAKVDAYPSWGQFLRSQPSICCFTLAWSKKKCNAVTMIQLSLQLWPKHCTSVGGPIKVLDSSLWELQPQVKDSSLEQHILKSGLALPSEESLALLLQCMPHECVSVRLSIKMRQGKAKPPPHLLLKHSIGITIYPWVHLPSLRVVGRHSVAWL